MVSMLPEIDLFLLLGGGKGCDHCLAPVVIVPFKSQQIAQLAFVAMTVNDLCSGTFKANWGCRLLVNFGND